MRRSYVPVPQVGPDHYDVAYEDERRWSSYWYQVEFGRRFLPGPILEIGTGSGTTSNYLRSQPDAKVYTVDIDLKLKPNILADISKLPFSEASFECVIACEVLEHMPYERTEMALAELRRVGKRALISVPNSNRYVFRILGIAGPRRKDIISVNIGRILPRRANYFTEGQEHYWELEQREYPLSRFIKSIRSAGWHVDREFRNPNFAYHHFFYLR